MLERTYYGTAWSADEAHLFYVVPDEAMRPYQVWRHRLGTPQADDVLVLQEDDERFFLGVELSRSEEVVLLTSESKTSGETSFIRAGEPEAEPVVVEPRAPDHEYSVDHQGDRFVILTNLDAEDFRVVTAPVGDPGRANWTDLAPHEPGRRIANVDAFDGLVVLHEWADACPGCGCCSTTAREHVLGVRRGGARGRPRRQPRVRHRPRSASSTSRW